MIDGYEGKFWDIMGDKLWSHGLQRNWSGAQLTGSFVVGINEDTHPTSEILARIVAGKGYHFREL